jgi:hypothetical protein
LTNETRDFSSKENGWQACMESRGINRLLANAGTAFSKPQSFEWRQIAGILVAYPSEYQMLALLGE